MWPSHGIEAGGPFVSAGIGTFRHAPGCIYATWNASGGDAADTDEPSEGDALRRLSLGRSPEGRHTDVYRCRECAAKGSLD